MSRPGLVRVVPTTTDEAKAIAHLHQGIKPDESLIIEDIRPGDDYVSSLKNAFSSFTKGSRRASEQFRGPDNFHQEGNTAVAFSQMVNTICTSKARYLFFAGRPVQLRQFVNELTDRGCQEKKFTVLSGSGASTLVNDRQLDWEFAKRGITIEYAAIAHPDGWHGSTAPKSGGSVADYDVFADLAESPGELKRSDLIDSRAITMYDAGLTAVTAIRNAGETKPSLTDVMAGWLRLHGEYGKVRGASGWICLDNYGNAYNKAVAIVAVDPRPEVKIRFLRIGWPTGKPTPSDCTAPAPRK